MGKCLFMRKGETHTKPASLPTGYSKLEYIQSTGTQYIDTGFKPNQDTRVVMDLQVSESHSGEGHLCSARSTTSGPYWILYYNNSEYTTRYGTQTGTALVTADKNRHTFDKNKNVTSIDSETIQNNYETFSVSANIPLLCRLTGTTADAFLSAKLYSCKIYDNGTLVRDFVPCINPYGEIGLYDLTNKRFYGNAGTGEFTCDLSFDNFTWEEIITACQTNTVPSVWKVGDQKTMTINGTNYTIDIIGKNHDDYADGSGKAPLTFQMHECYPSRYAMNSSNTNTDGWTSSQMRTVWLQNILNIIPTEVKSALREVNKLTSKGAFNSTIITTADKLFLLSEIEVFGTTSNSTTGEGGQYDYYKAGNSKVKTVSGSASKWWLRSPSKSNTSFVAVNTDGTSTHSTATSTYGVAAAFCF